MTDWLLTLIMLQLLLVVITLGQMNTDEQERFCALHADTEYCIKLEKDE